MAQQVKLQEEREKIVRDIKFSTKMGNFNFKTNETSSSTPKESTPYTKLPPKQAAEKNKAVYDALDSDLKTDEFVPIIKLDSKLPTDADFGI